MSIPSLARLLPSSPSYTHSLFLSLSFFLSFVRSLSFAPVNSCYFLLNPNINRLPFLLSSRPTTRDVDFAVLMKAPVSDARTTDGTKRLRRFQEYVQTTQDAMQPSTDYDDTMNVDAYACATDRSR